MKTHHTSTLAGVTRFVSRGNNAGRELLDQFIAQSGVVVPDHAPTMSVSAIRAPTMIVAHVDEPPKRATWLRARPSAQDRLLFVFVVKGRCRVERGEGSSLRPVSADADGVFYVVPPGTEPIQFSTEPGSEVLLFSVDRSDVSPVELRNLQGVVPDRRSALVRATYAYLMVATLGDALTEDQFVGVKAAMRAMALGLSLEVSSHAIRGDSIGRLRSLVALGSRRYGYNLAALASAYGASARSVTRLLSAAGTNFPAELRRARVVNAIDALSLAPNTDPTSLATASGFGSARAMRQAFQDVLGDSYARARKRLLEGENKESLLRDSSRDRA